MDFLNPDMHTGIPLGTGKLLIAEPFLNDPNFTRSIILLCKHDEEGSIGFSLNKPTDHTLGDLLPELYTPKLAIYQGGPVKMDTLHLLHRTPIAFGGTEIADGIYWGGSYDALQDCVSHNSYQPMDMRLFVGYSGWEAGQLKKEVEEGSWLIANVSPELIFDTDPDAMWKHAVESLGKAYGFLKNMPLNPQLN